MAELVREIEAIDIPKLKELMNMLFGDDEWKDIQRLGGMNIPHRIDHQHRSD